MKFFIALLLICSTSFAQDANDEKRCKKIADDNGLKYSQLERKDQGTSEATDYTIVCEVPLREVMKEKVTPKFKVGDCIEEYGSFVNKIREIMEYDYGMFVGTDCDDSNWTECSMTVHRISVVDKNGKKVDCPPIKKRR